MPSHRPNACRECHRSEADAGRISWRGLCAACGNARASANHMQLKGRPKGPFYDHWRSRTLAAFGVTVDERADEG